MLIIFPRCKMKQYLYINNLLILILILYTPDTDTSRPKIRPNKLVSYSIPENRALKKALGYHEDTYLNFTELVTKYNYTPEQHTVITPDGYILKLFRVLPKCERFKPYPVLMMHGLFDTADMWILAGPKISLGFVLASNCYDVWAANHRGNYYSRRHVELDPDKDPEYWNYSFDEHGNFDVPATVDYILASTGKSQLYYIGHSQGTTDGLIMTSMKPEYNAKIRLSVYIGPIAWMENIISPISILGAYNAVFVKELLESAGIYELFARDKIVHTIIEYVCEKLPEICEFGFSLSTGLRPGSIDLNRLSVVFGHLPSGTSIKTLAHFAQLIVNGGFQRYDEGIEGNMKRYGVPTAPRYNVTEISSPVLLVSAKNDWLSSLKDVDTLASKLPDLVENYIVPKPYWSHHNHIWDNKTPVFVNSKILDYLNKFNRY